MPLEPEILLCDCTAGLDATVCLAVLDERTLTYDVVERRPGREPRVLHRHVTSLRQARARACARDGLGVPCPYVRPTAR